MTAVKSLSQIRHLAENRLPVSGADVMRLVEENERLREALKFIASTDDVENMLDPARNKRAARTALRSGGEET